MASNVVRVSLLADASGFKKGFKEAEGSAKGFQKVSGVAAGAIGAYFGTQALGAVSAFVDESIQAYSDFEQATGAVETVFGAFADEIKEASEGAADALGLSAGDYQQLAANLGGQLQTLGYTVEESAAKTQELIGVGADLAATYGGSVQDAVAAVGSLMRGERDPIEKFAISVKDADIQARVLADGLDTSTTEAKKNAEATAALDILMGQASKTTGAFAREEDTLAGKMARSSAEIENNKALAGEALAPWQELKSEFEVMGAKTLGVLAIGFMDLTGKISGAQAAVMEFQTLTGEQADSLEALVTIQKESGESFEDLAGQMDLSLDELKPLNKEQKDFLKSIGYTQEEIDVLSGVLSREYSKAVSEGYRNTTKFTGSMEYEQEAIEGATEALDENTDALETNEEKHRRLLDPIFDFTEAQLDLAEAQQAVTDAANEFGEGSPEHQQALRDEASRTLDYEAALKKVTDEGAKSESAVRKLGKEAGLSEDAINQMVTDWKNANLADRSAKIRVYLQAPQSMQLRTNADGTIVHVTAGKIVSFAKGGIVTDPTLARIGEAGDEAVIPLNDRGASVLGKAMKQAGVEGSGGPIIINNITIHAGLGSDPNAISKALVEALQRYARNNGGIVPIRTRP